MKRLLIADVLAPSAAQMPAQRIAACDPDSLARRVDTYLDAMVAHDSSKVKLAPAVEIADVETGLVFGFSQFRHPFDEKFSTINNVSGYTKQDMNHNPFDTPVYSGKIHEIEAVGIVRPYNSKSGWE